MSPKHTVLCTGFNVAVCLLAFSVVSADENQPVKPREPVLPRAPEMSAWTVTYVYPSEKTGQRGKKTVTPKYRITSVKFEKTGGIYHKTTYWDTGRQTEAWSIEGREVIKEKSGSQYAPASVVGPLADDFKDSDFEDLAWVSMKYYTGLENGPGGDFMFHAKRRNRDLTRRETMAKQSYDQFRTPVSGSKSQPPTNPSDESQQGSTEVQSLDEEDTVILGQDKSITDGVHPGNDQMDLPVCHATCGAASPSSEVNTLLENWDRLSKRRSPPFLVPDSSPGNFHARVRGMRPSCSVGTSTF